MFQDKLTREIAAAAAQIKTEPPKKEVNTKSVEGAVMSIMTNEELKGNQHKIDANKNGKVDAHDFKLLRAKKGKEMQEGVKGAGLGAAVGSVAGGPVGAAIGGALGHVAGEVLSSAKNKAKAMGRIAVGPSMADSKMKREDVEQFRKDKEMQEGVKGAGVGAALGSVAGGPVGAAIGGALGHVAGEVLSSAKNKAKAMGRIAVGPSMADSKLKKEDIEQLDEIGDTKEGRKMISSYVNKALGDKNREKGLRKATSRLYKDNYYGKKTNEEVEMNEEDAYSKDRYAVKDGKAKKDNPTHMGSPNYKDQPHHVWATSAEHALKKSMKKEEVELDEEQLDERAKWRTSSIAHNTGYRKDGPHGGIENTADTGKEDLLRSRQMLSRYGTPKKSEVKSLKKSITKNIAQMKKEEVELDEAAKKKPYDKDEVAKKIGAAMNKADDLVQKGRAERAAARAIANAKYGKMKKEEVEQVDEAFPTVADAAKRLASKESNFEKKKISTGTVYSRKYKAEPEDNDEAPKKKAKTMKEMLEIYSNGGAEALVENLMIEEPSQDEYKKEVEVAHAKAEGKIRNDKGIAKAAAQGVKMEEVEIEVLDADEINGVQIDNIEERSLTDAEMNKREEIVKSMKKGIQGFKDRYGDKAKNVMYATAAKIAKEKA
jgi:uncharacterized protein (DUF697 family)